MVSLNVSQQGSGKDATVNITEEDDVRTWPRDASLAVVGKGYSRLEGNEKSPVAPATPTTCGFPANSMPACSVARIRTPASCTSIPRRRSDSPASMRY